MAVASKPADPRDAQCDDQGGTVLVGYSGQRRLIRDHGTDIGVIGGYEFRCERGRAPHTRDAFSDLVSGQDAQGATLTEAATALEAMIAAGFTIDRDSVVHLPLNAEGRKRTFQCT